jgi:predicted transcriptional regulator
LLAVARSLTDTLTYPPEVGGVPSSGNEYNAAIVQNILHILDLTACMLYLCWSAKKYAIASYRYSRMSKPLHIQLSRRERQIMDVIFRLGEASVSDVVDRMPDEPAYNTVRVTMGILEKKGYLKHRQDGQRYLYVPTVPLDNAKRSAVSHLLQTFFDGSPSKAVLAMLGMSANRLSKEDLDEISGWIEDARKEAE